MFGFKKRTVEEILSAIEKLSDEDREKLRSALNGELPQEQEEPEEEPTAEEAETPPAEETENGESAATEPTPENAPENVETQAEEEIPEPPAETPQGATDEAQEGQETIEEPPIAPTTEEPTVQPQDGVGDNTNELIEAQNAKIEALQSQLETSSDGELVISRYAVKENGAVTDVKTLFGFAPTMPPSACFSPITTFLPIFQRRSNLLSEFHQFFKLFQEFLIVSTGCKINFPIPSIALINNLIGVVII